MPSSSTLRPPDSSFGRWAAPAGTAAERGGTRGVLYRLIASMVAMAERSASRRHLAEMDDRMLRDVGVSPTERAEEIRKWFWNC